MNPTPYDHIIIKLPHYMVSLIITVSILNDVLCTRFLFLPHYTNRKLQFLPVHQPLPATDIVSPTLIRFGLGPNIPPSIYQSHSHLLSTYILLLLRKREQICFL